MPERIGIGFRWCKPAPRPSLDVSIYRVRSSCWPLFRPYHYMSADLVSNASCWVLAIADRPAAFAAVIHFPHAVRRDIRRVHRVVTLPDWQGLGLGMILIGKLGAAYRCRQYELRIQTASAFFARTIDRSPDWQFVRRGYKGRWGLGLRFSAAGGNKWTICFRFVGAADPTAARELLGD